MAAGHLTEGDGAELVAREGATRGNAFSGDWGKQKCFKTIHAPGEGSEAAAVLCEMNDSLKRKHDFTLVCGASQVRAG